MNEQERGERYREPHESERHRATTALADVPTVPIFGIPFSKLSMDQTVEVLATHIVSRGCARIITGNPIMVMLGLEQPAYHEVLRTADLVVPDGAGVVWAAGYAGEPVVERVAGFDLLHRLMARGEREGWKAYLLGASEETIREAASRLQAQYPGTSIVGFRNGFFGAAEDEAVIADIRDKAPDLLFVARAASNQEPWIAQHKAALGVPVMMGVGGSFDVIAGNLKRAPRWMQRLRMEWLFRLLLQPSRIGRMLALPKFAWKVIREKENVTKRHFTP